MKMLSKTLLVGLTALSCLTALAEPVVAEGTAAAKAAAEVKCVKACLIMDEEDVAKLSAQVDAAIQEAYQAGLKGWSKVSSN